MTLPSTQIASSREMEDGPTIRLRSRLPSRSVIFPYIFVYKMSARTLHVLAHSKLNTNTFPRSSDMIISISRVRVSSWASRNQSGLKYNRIVVVYIRFNVLGTYSCQMIVVRRRELLFSYNICFSIR